MNAPKLRFVVINGCDVDCFTGLEINGPCCDLYDNIELLIIICGLYL